MESNSLISGWRGRMTAGSALALVLLAAPLHADRENWRGRGRDREPPRRVIVKKPHVHSHGYWHKPQEYTRVVVRGHRHPYYHHRGHYYRKGPRGYILVQPPIGLHISVLPRGAFRLYYGGGICYYYGGVYYRPVRDRYVVISRPEVVYVEKEIDDPKTAETFVEPELDTVQVLNSNGSRTPVPLEALEEGRWKGPRGEIYDSLPTHEQLHSAYGF